MSWPTFPLGELCEMDRRGLRPDDPDAPLLPFVGVEHVEAGSGAIKFNNGTRVGSQKSTSFRFDERHILYGKLRPYLNKVATPEFAGKCSTELVPLLPRVGVDREFLGFLLRRQETVDYVMSSVTGARMPRTDMKALLSLPVPRPPLDEQRRIAGILNRATRIEQLRKRAQERLREFIPALFVRMFGDAVESPMEWKFPFATIGEICNLVNGRAFKPAEWADAGLPIVRIQNLRDSSKPMNKFDGEVHEKHLIESGDVLLSWSGTPGTSFGCFVWERGRAILNQHIFRVEYDNSRMERDFFVHAMNSRLDEMISRAHGGVGLRHITKAQLNKIKLPIPPLNEQREFARIIESARSLFAHETSGQCIADELNESLMSRLLLAGRADAEFAGLPRGRR